MSEIKHKIIIEDPQLPAGIRIETTVEGHIAVDLAARAAVQAAAEVWRVSNASQAAVLKEESRILEEAKKHGRG